MSKLNYIRLFPIVFILLTIPHLTLAKPTQDTLSSAKESDPLNPASLTPRHIAQCVRQDNPVLRVALAQLEQAKSQLTLARQSLFPSLSIDGLVAPLPARRLLKYCVSGTPSVEGLDQVIVCPNQDIQDDARLSDVNGMGIFVRTTATLTQPLYTFGKLTHGKEAAQAGVGAYQALTKTAQRHFDHQALQAYYGIALTQRAQRVFRKGGRHLKKLRKQIEKELKAETGKYTSNDLRKLRIKDSELKIASGEVSTQYQLAIRGIQLSCKLEQNVELKLKSRKLKPLKVELKTEQNYIEIALRERGEMKAAHRQVSAREALKAQAVSNFFPNIALIGTFGFARGTSADDNPDPFANDPFNSLGYGAYLGLSWRLNFAQLNSKLQASVANVTKAKAELYGLKQQITLEIGSQYLEVLRRAKALELRDQAQVQAKQWVTSTMMSQSAGLISVKDALDAITAYFTTSLAYDRDIYEYNLALIRLWSLSGLDPLSLLSD